MYKLPLPTEWTLRSASIEDKRAIRQLVTQNQLNPLGLEWQRFIVATDERDVLQACGQVKTHKDGTRELASIVVTKEWRGLGIGATIVQELIDTHPQPLWLMCRSGMAPWYYQFGFKEVPPDADQPRYFKRVRRFIKAWDIIANSEDGLSIMACET